MGKLNIIKENKDIPTTTNVYHHFTELKNENWKKHEVSFSEEYKKYRKRFENAGKNLIPDLVHLDIEASNFCDLGCTFCARTIRIQEGGWRALKHFDFEMYKKIIDNAIEVGVCSVNLNFLGEPLLNPKCVDMIRYAKGAGIIDVFLHTNGTQLNDKMCNRLIDSGLDKLSISFDSPYKNRFEEVRIGASYEQVLGNIRRFARIKKERGVARPLTRVNFIRLPGMLDKEIEDMVNLVGDIVDSLALLPFVDPYFFKKSKIPDDHISKWVCPQILNRMMIHSNNHVHVCCIDYDDVLDLGEFKKNSSLLDFWNSKKLQNIRKKHLEGKWFEVKGCTNCCILHYQYRQAICVCISRIEDYAENQHRCNNYPNILYFYLYKILLHL